MNELQNAKAGSLLQSLHAEVQLPVPYSEDVFLLNTCVAGTSHVVGIEEIAPFLRPGDRLELVRMPSNPSDPTPSRFLTGIA